MDNEEDNIEYENEVNEVNVDRSSLNLGTLNDVSKSVCKIFLKGDKNNETGTGFFLDLSDIIGKKCLVTNHHIISEEKVEKKCFVIIQLENKSENKNEIKNEIKIELNKEKRYIKYFKEPIDITIIEILDSDNIITDIPFFNYDEKYTEGYNQYINKKIFIMGYPRGSEIRIDQGKIIRLKNNFEFIHRCDSDYGSSGSPILLYDKTLIGIHKGKDKDNNKYATFIGTIINSLKMDEYQKLNSILLSNNNNSSINIDNISSKFKQFIDKYYEFENNFDGKNILNFLLKSIENLKLLFILMLGEDNLAIINILNGLIECQILPEECKNKNIIIKHQKDDRKKNDIILRKAKIRNKEDINLLDLNGEIIAIGFEDVQKKLGEPNEAIKDNGEFLYEIEINIKFVRHFNNNNLKEKICFIYLPDLFNKKNVYNKIIENCNIFLYTINSSTNYKNNNLKIFEDLKKLLPKYKDKSNTEFIKDYIKKCLFIINQDKDQKISREVLDNIMKGYLTNEEKNDLKFSCLNTGFYERYKNDYYKSLEEAIHKEYMRCYISNNSEENENDHFNEYLSQEFEKNFKNDIPSNNDGNNQSPSIEENTKEENLIKNYKINEENFKLFKIYFSLAKEYLSKEETVIEHNNESFIIKLENLIQSINTELNDEFKIIKNNAFKELERFIDNKEIEIPNNLEQNISPELSTLEDRAKIVKKNLINYFNNNDLNTISPKIREITDLIEIFVQNGENYVKDPNKKKENIKQFFKEQLDDLLRFLGSQKNKLSEYSNPQYNEFCTKLDELKQKYGRKLTSYKEYINNPDPCYKNIKNLFDFSVENQSKEAINDNIFLSIYYYFFQDQKLITIINHLAKETKKLIKGVHEDIKKINNDYVIHFNYEIDRLFKIRKDFEKKKCRKENNRKIQEYEVKKSKWKDIKNEYNDIKKEIINI